MQFENSFDVVVLRVEVENAFGLRVALLFDNGLEQFLLVFEIHVERPLGDAGRAGDLAHAGGIKTLRQKYRAGSLEDLAPLGVLLRSGGSPGVVRRAGRNGCLAGHRVRLQSV